MAPVPNILAGMGGGSLWALAVVWGGQGLSFGFLMLPMVMPLAMIAPGLVTIAMIATLAARRFFDRSVTNGQPFAEGSPGWVDGRVLANTMEQAVLALLLWPFVAMTLGGNVVLVMGLAFAVARLAFWAGYRLSPPLRAFGFAATFFPTILASVWSLVAWLG